MKLIAELCGETHEIDIVTDGEAVTARVGARSYDISASEPEPGVHLFKADGQIFSAAVTPAPPDYIVEVNGLDVDVKIIDPKRLRGSGSNEADASGRIEIRTAMPGKVVRVLKLKGDAVRKGEGVVVVEAMKMQNEMRSPKDGTVGDIRAAEGDTVGAGDILLTIE